MLYQMWMLKNSAVGNMALAGRSDAEREAQDQALVAAHTDTGARPLIMCDCGWANEEYSVWGITSFPNLDARIKQYQAMEQFGMFRYSDSFTLLGTAMEDPQPANITPGMVYSLWMVRNNPSAIAAYNALSQNEQEALWGKHESNFQRLGGCLIIRCNAYWANDAYRAFGVEAFPSLEAVQQFKAEMGKVNWPLYIPAISILGTLNPMQSSIDTMFGPIS